MVAGGDLAAILVEAVQMLEHHPSNRSIDLIEAHIVAGKFVIIFPLPAMIAQHAQPVSHLRVIGRDTSAVAKHRQVLGREETEGPEAAHAAGGFSLVFCAFSL